MDPLREMELDIRARGFVTRRAAVAKGIPDSTFTDLGRRLALTPRYTGLWVPEETDPDPIPAAAAALEAIGAPALLTGATALRLLGVPQVAAGDVEVAVPLRRSPARRDGICVHHTCTFDAIRYQHVGRLAVARAERAIADYAAHTSFKGLATAIAHADRLRLVQLSGVEVARRRRFAGRGVLRSVLAQMREEVTHSTYERRARRLLAEAGHRPHRRPFTIADGNHLVGAIDVPFIDIKYGVEVDEPHHLLASVAAADRARDRHLSRLGWEIDRFFWFELDERPRWLVSEVSRRIGERPK